MYIHAKKSLGQHFLISKQVVFNLIRAADITENDIVLEVGPGRGFITEELIKTTKKVIAVEKDERLVDFLKTRFSKEIEDGKFEIVFADILAFEPHRYGLEAGSWKLLGAIPYYITGILLRTVLENENRPKTMALIIQKEVAERIMAKNNKESLVSLGVKTFGTPKYVQTVPASFFSPPPKVDSAILAIDGISGDFFTRNGIVPERFFEILHVGFAHKRKMLLPSLAEWLKLEKDALSRAFDECGISQKTRPEEVGLPKWGCLVNKIRISKSEIRNKHECSKSE